MKVLLDAIQFCHDPTSATHNALTIRRDATRDVVRPEWRRGACVGPEDSPVAYAISETRSHTITIKARFRRMVPCLDAVEIRALDPALQDGGWLAAWLRRVGLLRSPSTNPLGEVSPRGVTFGPDGLSEFETFELAGTRLEELGVGAWTTIWHWQYRQAGGSWLDFDRSEHRTFVLLELPKEPWTAQVPAPPGLVLPRVDALEYACRWAQGSRTRTEAAAGVTRGIYSVGPNLLRYNRPGGGSLCYSRFLLTLFLQRLRGGEGNGPYVNCDDCANAVTSLANLLGCELWSSQIWDEDPETGAVKLIVINPIIPIGERDWGFPFPEIGEAFLMHQVALDGEGTSDDHVFDACLMVDGDDDPTKASPTRLPLLPEGLPFAQPTGLAYRERFAAPEGRACRPLEEWRYRWPIIEPNVTSSEPRQTPATRQLARLAEWSGTRSPGADILFWPFDMTGSEVPGWRVIRADRAFEGGGVPHIHFLMSPERGDADSRLRVETWQLPSRERAHAYLAELLGRLEGGPPPRLEPPPAGDIAFAGPNRYFLAFARGNLIVWLRNAGLQLLPVEDAAAALDRWLTHRPETPPDHGPADLTALAAEAVPSAPIGFKYFADHGELRIKDGSPILQGAAAAGGPVVRVALHPSSRHVAEMLDLSAE